jgi:glutaredoxin
VEKVEKVDIEFESPSKIGFTIYSKSGCPNCTNVKKLLQENKMEYLLIDCDEYLIEERDKFLEFIVDISKKEVKTFPMIFFDDKFVGGFKETKEYIDRVLVNFNF